MKILGRNGGNLMSFMEDVIYSSLSSMEDVIFLLVPPNIFIFGSFVCCCPGPFAGWRYDQMGVTTDEA